jgi:hypothetical protein
VLVQSQHGQRTFTPTFIHVIKEYLAGTLVP